MARADNLRARASRLRRSDTGRAGGMAVAVAAGNVASLVFTMVFARLLGAGDYGALASLLSTFLILSVPGTALQATIARDVGEAHGRGDAAAITASLRSWTVSLAALGGAASVAAFALHEAVGDLIGVEDGWAAASTVPTAMLWMLASVQRGALQGLGRYRVVGLSVTAEAAARLLGGLLLLAAGLGVAGAFLGYAVALSCVAVALGVLLAREVGDRGRGRRPTHGLVELLRAAAVPTLAVTLLTALQNLDVVIVKRETADTAAGVFATASLLAKSVVWVAYGLGLYILPEASRRTTRGEPTRPLLARTIGLVVGAGAALLVLSLLAGEPLLELLFGEPYGRGSEILPLLALGMTLLGLVYVLAQYAVALRRRGFLWLLGAATLALPAAVAFSAPGLRSIALTLLVLHGCLLAAVAALELLGKDRPR